MFEIMAGVRGENPLFEPKGMPEDAGWDAKDGYYLYVNDKADDQSEDVPRARAESWVKSGQSQWYGDHWVSDPDAHTPSWLSSAEFTKCIMEFKERCQYKFVLPAAYSATLAAMLKLEQEEPGETRLVFWFDN